MIPYKSNSNCSDVDISSFSRLEKIDFVYILIIIETYGDRLISHPTFSKSGSAPAVIFDDDFFTPHCTERLGILTGFCRGGQDGNTNA